MKKRITSLLLVVVMVLTMTISVTAASTPFTDVAADAWYKSAVEWAYTNKIASGTSETKFSPNMNMTRAMFVTMLYRMNGPSDIHPPIDFLDVPSGQWYTEAVAWAYFNGFVSGVGLGRFAPNDNITRQDIVTILYRYSGYPSFTKTTAFADMSSVSDYAKTAVEWAKANNIISGKGNNLFDPRANATRAEVVQILYNYSTKYQADTHTHDWKTETIHHDAVMGTRDVTETWTHATVYCSFKLTPKGLQEMPELGNGETGLWHIVKAMEYEIKGTTLPALYNDPLWNEVTWIYKYNNTDDPEGALLKDIALGKYEVNGVNVTGYLDRSGYSDKTDTYTETRTVGTEEYVITKAYDETISTCTICGATQ